MPKKRVLISQDYDGCYAIAAKGGVHAERMGRNKEQYAKHPIHSEALEVAAEEYHGYLTQITAHADAVSVYVGSYRQSYGADQFNIDNNKNGSVFPALRELCAQRTTEEQPWTFEPFLLADGDYPRGTALAKIDSGKGPHLTAPETRQVTKTNKPSKIPMLIAQMRDAYRHYPEEELEFHFVDDLDDLIDDICTRLDPREIPPRMVLKISKFNFYDFIEDLPDPLGLVKTINSICAEPAAAAAPAAQEQLRIDVDKSGGFNESDFKRVVNLYLAHLQQGLKEEGLENEAQRLALPDDAFPVTKKLVIRYDLVMALHEKVKDKEAMDEQDIDYAKKAVLDCLKNGSSWDEKRFINPLMDLLVLSLRSPSRPFFPSAAAAVPASGASTPRLDN